MQEGETTKDFCDKIRVFLQKRVGFSQAGKGDRQTEVIALTAAIRADSQQEAYLVALSAFGSNPSKIDMQIGLCFKIFFPLCYLLSSLTDLLPQLETGLAISPYPSYGPAAPHTPLQHHESCARAAGGMRASRGASSRSSPLACCSTLLRSPRFWSPRGTSRLCIVPQYTMQGMPQRKREERFS